MLLGDGVDDDGALFVDEDGVALDQLEAGDLGQRGRQAGGGAEISLLEERGAAEPGDRAEDALAAAPVPARPTSQEPAP